MLTRRGEQRRHERQPVLGPAKPDTGVAEYGGRSAAAIADAIDEVLGGPKLASQILLSLQ